MDKENSMILKDGIYDIDVYKSIAGEYLEIQFGKCWTFQIPPISVPKDLQDRRNDGSYIKEKYVINVSSNPNQPNIRNITLVKK